MAKPYSVSEVLQACQTLFGSEVDAGIGFLFYLQPEGLKAAYRKKVKETHPDFFTSMSPAIQKEQASLFCEVVEAYEVVSRYITHREKGPYSSSPLHAFNGLHEQTRESWDPGNRFYQRESTGPCGHKPLPSRALQIGQYLYCRGLISYRSLIEAIVWQRRQRPVIGDISLRWKWLNKAAIDRIVRTRNLRGRFGEKALDLDLLTPFQVKVLLNHQFSQQERLGTYFVRQGIMKADKLDQLVHQLSEHNMRF